MPQRDVHLTQPGAGAQHRAGVAARGRQREALLERGQHRLLLVAQEPRPADSLERRGDLVAIVERAPLRERLLEAGQRRVAVALPAEQVAGAPQGAGTGRARGLRRGRRQRRQEVRRSLRVMRAREPEPREEPRQVEVRLGIAAGEPGQGRGFVLELRLERARDVVLALVAPGVAARGEGADRGGVRVARGLETARLGQALARVLAHRLEQAVAASRRPRARPRPATCRPARRAGRAPRTRRRSRRRPRPRLERRSRRRTRRGGGGSPARRGEQVVAPVDGRAQRLLARQRLRLPPVSRRKRSSSRARICSTAEHASPRRRQLDRERDAVEAAADLGHGRRVRRR